MASENIVGGPVGLSASADLSTKQHRFVKMSAAMKVTLCGDGELPIGVLQNNPDADGKAATVAGVGSTTKIIAGSGGITYGSKVSSDANGAGVIAADGDWMAGIALDSVAEGEKATLYLCPVSLGIDDDTV